MSNSHRSTTHAERFYHVLEPKDGGTRSYKGATVFFREEPDIYTELPTTPTWMASIALCSEDDQWCKRIGRNVARRRYFQGEDDPITINGVPSYEVAKQLYSDLVGVE